MDKEIVSRIVLPDDSILELGTRDLKLSAKELISGIQNRNTVEFVINNLGVAVKAAHDDFCCNDNDSTYFVIRYGNEMIEMAIDLTCFPHLFGIFGDNWKKSDLYKWLTSNNPSLEKELNRNDLSWMDKMAMVYNPRYMQQIISHECSDRSKELKKLNYTKMMVKLFSFINLGMLEEGTTSLYKINAKGNTPLLLVRSLRNGELEDPVHNGERYYDKQLILQLYPEDFDGQIVYSPRSILIVNKPLKNGKRDTYKSSIKLREDFGVGRPGDADPEYKFKALATIERKVGKKYARKGQK